MSHPTHLCKEITTKCAIKAKEKNSHDIQLSQILSYHVKPNDALHILLNLVPFSF